jgi:riboflavin kinase
MRHCRAFLFIKTTKGGRLMQRKRKGLLDGISQPRNNTLLTNHYLNLPDLYFFQRCNEHYQINRGVYNIIDEWFFNQGIVPVEYRRIFILSFLDFVSETNEEGTTRKFVKFGHGGVLKKLTEFMNHYLNPGEESHLLYIVKN